MVQGTICQKHPFGKHPFVNPRLMQRNGKLTNLYLPADFLGWLVMHWTVLRDRNTDHIGKKHPKFCSQWLWAIFQARKRHTNVKFLVRLPLGRSRVCLRGKAGLSLGQTPGTHPCFLLICTVEAQFVPGTNRVCPWTNPGSKGGRKSLGVKSLCAFFVR